MIFASIMAQVDPSQTAAFLVLGYVAMSIIGLVYVLTLVNRQRNLKQDIHLLRQLLEEDKQDK